MTLIYPVVLTTRVEALKTALQALDASPSPDTTGARTIAIAAVIAAARDLVKEQP